MHLIDLVKQYPHRPLTSAPHWLLGCYRRYSISFANGQSDIHTQVYWVQSRNFTIDIRMPMESLRPQAKPLSAYSNEELQQLASFEGFSANTDWDGTLMSWRDADAAIQIHNRWTEPAILKRVGNCMIEFCPSDAYVEDWRLQASDAGPLIGLHLLEETEVATDKVRHQGGGLIVCGDHAALMLGRAEAVIKPHTETTLSELVAASANDVKALTSLFNVETSMATGSITSGFKVHTSNQAHRVGAAICPLDGFEAPVVTQHHTLGEIITVRQTLVVDGIDCQRLFYVDTLEEHVAFDQATPIATQTQAWFERESASLLRHAERIE